MENIQTPLGLVFQQLASVDPTAPALSFNGITLSRAELDRRSNRWLQVLTEFGVRPGSLVTIGLPNCPAFIEVAIATWKLGAVPQPISSRLPIRELVDLVTLADPALVVGMNPGDGRPWLPADYEPEPSLPDHSLSPAVSPTWKAMTSGGSTGKPKLILSGSPGTFEAATVLAPLLKIEPGGVFLCTGPLYHNGPFMFCCLSMFLGNHVVLMSRFESSKALELIEYYQITLMYTVPTMMHRILQLDEAERLSRNLSSLRTVFHLAAPCPQQVKRAWIEWLGPHKIMELYAGTEAQAATVISGQEWLEHPGSVGKVAFGQMKIMNSEGKELAAGEIGEVWLRPPEGLTTYKYIGAEAQRQEGWESLGDMGYFDQDNYLYLADRKSDMILVGGSNVYPAEVEAALLEHPLILSACVIGLPDEEYGNLVHAIIQPSGEISDQEMRDFLAERLISYKIPSSFERTTEGLRDEADKVRRSALRQARLEKLKI